jgi:protein kinase C substrate 80K-H
MFFHVDCCDGSDEYESDVHCQNTCQNRKGIAEADDGGVELSVTRLDATNEFTDKHTIDIENHVHNNINKDLIQKLGGIDC